MNFKVKFCFRSAPRTRNNLQAAESATIHFSCKLLVHSYVCDRGPVDSWLSNGGLLATQNRLLARVAPPLARDAPVFRGGCGGSCSFPHLNCHIPRRWLSNL